MNFSPTNIFWKLLFLEQNQQNSLAVLAATGMDARANLFMLTPLVIKHSCKNCTQEFWYSYDNKFGIELLNLQNIWRRAVVNVLINVSVSNIFLVMLFRFQYCQSTFGCSKHQWVSLLHKSRLGAWSKGYLWIKKMEKVCGMLYITHVSKSVISGEGGGGGGGGGGATNCGTNSLL